MMRMLKIILLPVIIPVAFIVLGSLGVWAFVVLFFDEKMTILQEWEKLLNSEEDAII